MYLTTHATAGLLAGIIIPHPIGAFCGGIISHLVLDSIPHEQKDDLIMDYPSRGDKSDPKSKDELAKTIKRRTIISICDLVLTLGLIYYAYFLTGQAGNLSMLMPIYAGIFGGLLPDIIIVQCLIFDNKFLRWYFLAHNRFHFIFADISMPRWISMMYQAVLAAIMVYFASGLV